MRISFSVAQRAEPELTRIAAEDPQARAATPWALLVALLALVALAYQPAWHGGLLWDETMQLLAMIGKRRRIVGFDVVELAPDESNPYSAFVAAKLTYKLLNAAFSGGR